MIEGVDPNVWMTPVQKALGALQCKDCGLTSYNDSEVDRNCRIYDFSKKMINEEFARPKPLRSRFLSVKVTCSHCDHVGYVRIDNPIISL